MKWEELVDVHPIDDYSWVIDYNSSENAIGEKMQTVNIKDIPESKMVKLVDLSEDSINKIAEAVVRKIKEQEKWQIPYGGEVVMCEECKFFEEDEYGNPCCSRWDKITYAYGFCHEAKRNEVKK